MKYLFLFFLLTICLPVRVNSQHKVKPVVRTAVYFDISPALRSMNLAPVARADQSWKEGVVRNFFRVPGHQGAMGNGIDTTVQSRSGLTSGDTIIQNFEGQPNLSNVAPPDPCGDVGPGFYFQMVNFSCAIYNKAGVKILGPFSSASLWNGMPHNANNGDGIVLYDEHAGRWFVSQLSLPNFPNGPYYQMIAVSQTSDPTGSWFRWEFAFSVLPDYPKFGIWNNGYYMSCNRINSAMVYVGTGLAAFDRTAMLSGDPDARMILFELNSGDEAYSVVPADCDGDFPFPGTPEYFLYVKRNFLGIREFHANWNVPANSTLGNAVHISVSPFVNLTEGIPQRGTPIMLMPLADPLMFRLQFRKFGDHESMVANHTVDAGKGTGIRWYELRRTSDNWNLFQQSTWAPDSNYRWMGSIAMDSSGNIALGYSVSGKGLFPAVRYTGRMAHDPAGRMTIAEREIIPGSGAQTGEWGGLGRWGDYSALSVDPASAATFWYTQEYFDSTSWNGWKTRIASFSFAGIFTMHATTTTPMVCQGGSCKLGVEVSGGTGNYSYLWSSVPAGFSSVQREPVVTPAVPTRYIAMVSDGVSLRSDTLLIGILDPPQVFSGNDSSYCDYIDQVNLEARASGVVSVKWTTTGDGIFSDENSLNTSYFPGDSDKSSGIVRLKLKGLPQPPCSPVSSEKQITFKPCPGIDETDSIISLVEVFPNPVHGKFVVRIHSSGASPAWIRVFDPTGKLIISTLNTSKAQVKEVKADLSGYAEGIFMLKVKTGSRVVQKKIILQR